MLVLMAVGVTVARLVTPVLNQHRADFEVWASKILERPVKIGRVRAWWEGFEPELKLENVSVYDSKHQKIAIQIDDLQIGINVFKSFFVRKLEPSKIEIYGVHVIVHQLTNQTIKINGIRTEQNSGHQTLSSINSNEMVDWLLSRPHVALSQISVKWYTPQNKLYSFLLRKLEFDNSGEEHSLRGYATLLQASPMHVHFGLYLEGNIHHKKHLKVIVYTDLQNVLLSQWIGKKQFNGFQVLSGLFNGQVWLKWHHQRWETVQSLYKVTNLKVQTKQSTTLLTIKHVLGNLSATLNGSHWKIISQFKQLNFMRWNKIPGLNNLSGVLQIQPNKGELNLNTQNATINFGKLFSAPIFFSSLKGHVNWQQLSDRSWEVTGSNVGAQNKDVTAKGEFGLLFPAEKGKQPILSLLGGFNVDDPSQVKHYLPLGIMHTQAIEWLNHAFLGGEGGSGTVIVRGPLHEFPFDHHEGTFVVDSKVHNIDFHYAPGWPDAHNINAGLIFSGRSMTCDATSGQVNNIQLQNAHAVIPYLGYKHKSEELHLNLNANAEAEDLLQFLHQSPLENSVGNDLKPLRLTGFSSLNLKLNIPLMFPEKTKVDGNITLSNVEMTIPEWGIAAHQLNGHVIFTEKSLLSNKLQATIFNQPTTLVLNTVHKKENKPYTQVSVASRTTISFLQKRFKFLKNAFISGSANYKAVLNLHTAKNDDQPNLLSVSSNLQGININLPYPLGKVTAKKVPFNMSVSLSPDQPVMLNINYGKIFSTALFFKRAENQLNLFSADLHLGGAGASIKNQSGIFIDGYLPKFDWKVWKQYFDSNKNTISQHKPDALAEKFKDKLQKINIKVGKTAILGQPLSNIKVQVEPTEDGWKIGLDSLRIAGQLLLPNNISQGITGRFKRLYLVEKKSKTKTTKKIDPTTIPPLDIQADNFQYGAQYFGAINLLSSPIKNGIKIRQLIINAPLLYTSMTGSWLKTGAVQHSHIRGEAKTKNLDRLLKALNIHSSLVGTDGRATFDLDWPGPFYSPTLKTSSGQIKVKLGKGWIVDLGESTTAKLNLGRLLTLLSINRLLVMNFDDLSQKGYGFDTMEGTLNLKAGKISMKKLLFDGSVARIISSGSINLINKTLDLDLAITPYLTSSLPIVATIAGGPIAGVATWVASKLFSQAVAKITTYDYAVTGPWHKPNVHEKYEGAKAPVSEAS